MERDLLKEEVEKHVENGFTVASKIDEEIKQKLEEAEQEAKTVVHFLGRSVAVQTEQYEPPKPQSLPENLMFSTYGPSPPQMMESQYPEMAQSTFQLQTPTEEK